MYMKKLVFLLLPFALMAWGCSGDQITTDDEGTTEDSGVSVDCSTLNTDIAALQILSNEAVAGSTVTDLSGSVITFSSGETATVTVRNAYSFNYANPTISVGSSKWLIDGNEIDSAFADETLKIKGSNGYWYAWYGSAWNKMNEILEGSSIPVFASLTSDDDNVYVKLTDGLEMSFAKYAGSESISLSSTSASIEKEGGSASVTVTSSAEWTATASASWVTLSKSEGASGESVTVTVPANEGTARSAYVTFTAGDVSAKFIVGQDGESGGGIISSDDTEDSDDNVSNTEFDRTIYITWASSGATVTGDGNGIVSVSGGNVTANNTGTDEKVIYELSGSTSNGSFKLYSDRKQAIVLNGVSITNPAGAAINVQGTVASPNKGKRTFVVVTGTNTLADGSSAAYSTTNDEDMKAVFFGEGQLVFSGSGSLTINANNKQGKAGLTSDDYIRFMSSPTISVNSGSSAGHGVRGKDYILVSNGTVNAAVAANCKKGFSSDSLVRFDGGTTVIKVTGGAAKDEDGEYTGSAGIKADQLFEMTGGSVTITNSGVGGKGIKVGGNSTDKVYIGTSTISGGSLSITTTGANYTTGDVSSKGFKIGWAIKSGNKYTDMTGDLLVTGGKVYVNCAKNEALEVKKTLTVKGGEIYAYSASDDAINCASTMTIEGGYVCGISSGNDAIDSNGNCYIKGGVVYAAGKSSPELGIDANTEGGYKLYVQGGTIFAIGGLESGASLTQSCYSVSSWSKSTWYALTVGSNTYAFKTPSSGGTPLVVSGSSTPTLKSGVTVSGGTSYFDGNANVGGSISGGSSVSLSSYSGGNSGGGPGGGGPGGGGGRW